MQTEPKFRRNLEQFETLLNLFNLIQKIIDYVNQYFMIELCVQILQPDMWGVTPSNRHDWATLRENIKKYEHYISIFQHYCRIVSACCFLL